MNELQLIKSACFGTVQCDIYRDGNELYMTREQVGAALEYTDPMVAIGKIHDRHAERIGKFSFTKMVNGRKTYFYTRKGVMEICRHSNQPKADAFMDWVWEVMDGLITGKTKLVGMTEYQQMMTQTRAENAKIRKAQILERLAVQYDGTYKQVLHAYATRELTGDFLLPLPKLEAKTYTAAEIGERVGITAHAVGTLTNRHNLKNEEYGAWFNDKAKGHNKEVPSFRYYESIIPVLEKLVKLQSA